LEGEETLQSNKHTSIYAIMAFDLSIPQLNGNSLDLALDVGKSLFILGANGTGKSSLCTISTATMEKHDEYQRCVRLGFLLAGLFSRPSKSEVLK
jgi:hypothetical protein